MRRADRLFQIIQFLRTRRVTTARWLADRLEVSERTIYRDVKDLVLSGVNIESEVGVGYSVRRGFDLPPLMFNEEEISALTLGARLVQTCADRSLSTAAQSALSKIELAIPKELKEKLDKTPLFSPLLPMSATFSNYMVDIRLAANQRRKIRLVYQRADKEQSDRIIWPLGLFFWGKVWTIGAWCETRDSFRVFRLDRICTLEILADIYPIEKGKRLQDFIDAQGRVDCNR